MIVYQSVLINVFSTFFLIILRSFADNWWGIQKYFHWLDERRGMRLFEEDMNFNNKSDKIIVSPRVLNSGDYMYKAVFSVVLEITFSH